MHQPHDPPVTYLLHRWREGDSNAADQLFSAAATELRKIAGHLFRNERGSHTLQPTAVVNEAFVRLLGIRDMEWQDRNHFYAFAATAMRRVLVDHARARASNKRGGEWVRTELPLGSIAWTDPVDILAIEQALNALQEVDPDRARLAVMRFYSGLSSDELADVFGVSTRTIKRRWQTTRAWLKAYLQGLSATDATDNATGDPTKATASRPS